ncbi:radical SAM family heme chaperone HemW [Halanaerobium hydrogeniformans]|uniref:Heme chaperone HemW n=1 Tax=Halanaerobium hydrogeniformans TaxID=656519 RepID=E4RIP0_HALHG|nr:radical SAM family heme chaperone HemW [Halanaerobium hydrogeniformans]ADQ15110.1 oxygen-independent coproporphyrinogen III oxidase [Halanaerobium hydrogeniformans]
MNKEIRFSEPSALYIHIPFCHSKCPYCDFYSVEYNKKRVDLYWAALFKELDDIIKSVDNKLLRSIYIGGGTPSLICGEKIFILLNKIRNSFNLPPTAEITIEANPFSLNEEKIILYKRSGINRISLGVQSFNNKYLNFLGRNSTRKKNINAIKLLKKYFDNYSIDLIFALPGQSVKDFKKDLEVLTSFNPPHISLYNLEIHEQTPFYDKLNKGEFKLPADKIDAEMYNLAQQFLLKADYNNYEISNFAKSGYRAQHNYLYWNYKRYIGLGPGAAGFNGRIRYKNNADLNKYLKSFSDHLEIEKEINILSKEDMMAEYCFLALRTQAGVSLHRFNLKFKKDFNSIFRDSVDNLKRKSLLEESNQRIYLTAKGKLLANEVFLAFLK